MFRPSFTAILCGLFIAYMVHSMFSMVKLFIPPTCEADKVNDPSCLRTTLKTGSTFRTTALRTKLEHWFLTGGPWRGLMITNTQTKKQRTI